MAPEMPKSPAERRRLRKLIADFRGKRILVVGDAMLDQYIRGSVERISPEAPVPVVHVQEESFIPGGAGNVASNLAALGARVSVIAVVGSDPAGRRLAEDFAALRIARDGLVCDPRRVTSLKCRVVAERQQVVRYDRETRGPLRLETEARILALLPASIRQADAVILSDYGKGVIAPKVLSTAIALARRRGVPVTVDPKVEHFSRYRRVTCITPNLHEAWAGMRRTPKPEPEAIEKLGRGILRILRSDSVLITRGPDGMSLFEPGRTIHIPTRAREVFDVSGAGDTVISTLTLALASGATIYQAALLSNYAAGIVVGKLGTATTDAAELAEALR